MFFKAAILDPASTESKGRIVLVNVGEKGFGFGVSDWDWGRVEVFHVVTRVEVFYYVASINMGLDSC